MAKLLLITGIPGTGKTEIAKHLEADHHFIHFDRELINSWPLDLQILWKTEFTKLLGQYNNRDIVISWGFMPGYDDAEVRSIIDAGFKMIWFDGNRKAARRVFIRRGYPTVDLLEIQMERINNMDLAVFNPTTLNTFNENGEFLTREEIASKLMALFSK